MANEDPEGHAMSQLAKLYSEAGKKALAAQYYLKVCIFILVFSTTTTHIVTHLACQIVAGKELREASVVSDFVCVAG